MGAKGPWVSLEDWYHLWSGGMICESVSDVSGGARRLEVMETVSSIFGGKLNILVKGFKVTGSVCSVTSKSERKKPMSTVPSLFDGELNILVNMNVGMLYFNKNTDFPSEGRGNIVFMSSVSGVASMSVAYLEQLKEQQTNLQGI